MRKKKKYLIVIEETKTGYSTYCPDLPGCVATGPTEKGLEREMKSAIRFHLEGMREEGIKIPAPRSFSTYYETEAA